MASHSKQALEQLRGAYCPLVVPFADGRIDFDTYGKLIERQIDAGTHGLLVNATSGEPTMLSRDERASTVEFAIKVSNGRRPVCAGTASESLEDTLALVERFDRAGADSIVVVTPYYSAPPQRGMVSYFAEVGKRTERPLLVYHIPGRAGVSLTVDTVAAIKEKVPHFVGMKNTDADISLVTGTLARLGRDFRIFAGLEHPTLPTLAVGGAGMMITASNVAPRLVASMFDQFSAGAIAQAQETNFKLYPLFRAVSLEASPIPVKYMLKKLGVTRSNEHRLPMVPATPEVERQLDGVLARIGLT
jgi:4-hydroxy-tetrahydrodipicolinate synthase